MVRHARFAALAMSVSLAIAACSGSATPAPSAQPSAGQSAAAPARGGSAVSIANFAFAPASVTVAAGTTVTWTNADNTEHTVTADDGSFKSDKLGTGAAFSQTFTKAGTFAYHCSIHPSMKGTITVH